MYNKRKPIHSINHTNGVLGFWGFGVLEMFEIRCDHVPEAEDLMVVWGTGLATHTAKEAALEAGHWRLSHEG